MEYISADKEEFCEQRKKGATKIAREASGGPGRLTKWHFDAKLPEYDECEKSIKDNKGKEHFKQKMLKYLRDASIATNQRGFQELMGKAEVWGEVYQEL
jgi:hypothetical protein